MITIEFFTYSEPERDAIRAVIRDVLRVDADQIERQITPVIGQYSIVGMETLWNRIETAASAYHLHGAVNRRSPHRDELVELRKKAESLRASIISAVAVPVGTKSDPLVHPLLLNAVDPDMLTATSGYFRKLILNLDRQIEQGRSRRDSARKTDRDQFWNELLAIWCDLGGKASGEAAANFLIAASKPVMGSAVPTLKSVVQWLERRQNRARRRETR